MQREIEKRDREREIYIRGVILGQMPQLPHSPRKTSQATRRYFVFLQSMIEKDSVKSVCRSTLVIGLVSTRSRRRNIVKMKM